MTFLLRLVDRLTDRVSAARASGRIPGPDVVAGWLLAAHVVMKLLILPLVVTAPPYGDEVAYVDAGRALSNLLRDAFALTPPDVAELERNVVASGWFMPGMGVLLAPLFVVWPDAPDAAVRVHLGLVTLLLLLAVVRSVRRRVGPWYAVLVLLFPGLVPGWVVLSYTSYGDSCAGLVLIALVGHAIAVVRDLRAGAAPGIAEALRLGLLAIAVVYLRSSASTAVIAVGLVVGVLVLVLAAPRERPRALLGVVVAVGAFVAVLTPWSLFASQALDHQVVTTTTVPVSLANTFGEGGGVFERTAQGPPKEICFGPCDRDSTKWFAPLRYSREVARATGVSEVRVQEEMAENTLQDISPPVYARKVIHNLGAYLIQPGNFAFYIEPELPEGETRPGAVVFAGQILVAVTTYVPYVPVLLLMMCGMVTVQRRSLDAQVLDLVTKLALGALLVQPFVHVAGGRYWTTAGPLFAFAAAGFVLDRKATREARPDLSGDGLAQWLLRCQWLLAGATGAAAVVLLALALVP